MMRELPSGDQSVVEPPGPIPNPEVKRHSANGSGTIGPVRVGRRQVYARHFENIQSAGLFFYDVWDDRKQCCIDNFSVLRACAGGVRLITTNP